MGQQTELWGESHYDLTVFKQSEKNPPMTILLALLNNYNALKIIML